jgi:hypothetical protein
MGGYPKKSHRLRLRKNGPIVERAEWVCPLMRDDTKVTAGCPAPAIKTLTIYNALKQRGVATVWFIG